MPKTRCSYRCVLSGLFASILARNLTSPTASGRVRVNRLVRAGHPIKCILTVSVFALVWVEEPLSG
jgi:hypothetical protein